MPTERFFNLPDEKKKKIRQAAIAEFSRVPMEKVSINQIVKAADISRGSFYTYFKDKTDLLHYILKDLRTTTKDQLIQCLTDNDGDFFLAVEQIMEHLLHNQQAVNSSFFKNLLSGLRLSDNVSDRLLEPSATDQTAMDDCENLAVTLFELTDLSCWTIQSYQDFSIFLESAMAMFISSFTKTILFSAPTEETLAHFQKKLSYLKNGVHTR